MSDEGSETMPTLGSHVARQLQGERRELQAVLDNQARDRTMLVRFHDEVTRMRGGLDGVTRDVRDLKADLLLIDNRLLSRHNGILGVLRRSCEDAGAAPRA
jgi:hypothetical protein